MQLYVLTLVSSETDNINQIITLIKQTFWLAGCFGTIPLLTHFIKFCNCYVEFKIHGCWLFKNTVEAALCDHT